MTLSRIARAVLPLLAATLASAASAEETKVQIPEGAVLTQAIRKADGDLFGLFFEGCDPQRLRGMITQSLEFYHDRGGVVSRSGPEFADGYARQCEARKARDAWRSRRELVRESLHVDPVPGFGAMETGEHYFYERQGNGPEKRVGKAAFAMVWQLDGGVWKLHRVLSYSHAPAE